ncbi:MAG: pantoate--beta-alanine ligase [Anaerolineales bacterium]
MITATTLSELQQALNSLERPVGFVPTMGYLHDGHLSLVHKARGQNPSVVVSIFANPTQFAPEEDLENYPRDIDRDLALLEGAKADLVWIPTVEVIYPEDSQTWVEVDRLTKVLEGSYRPTHFRGVTTVVAKLFNAVGPDRAYFGQKDAQQAAVLKQMVKDLNYPIEMVICPIVREEDGLAMSSRNTYLGDQERRAALCLSRGLFKARDAFQEGERGAEQLRAIVRSEVAGESLADLQYISCADPESLQELEGRVERCLLSLAVYVGKTRLIDNILLGS